MNNGSFIYVIQHHTTLPRVLIHALPTIPFRSTAWRAGGHPTDTASVSSWAPLENLSSPLVGGSADWSFFLLLCRVFVCSTSMNRYIYRSAETPNLNLSESCRWRSTNEIKLSAVAAECQAITMTCDLSTKPNRARRGQQCHYSNLATAQISTVFAAHKQRTRLCVQPHID